MSGFSDYDQYDGLGLADLVRRAEVTPVELLDEAINRTETVNPKINAVVQKLYDRARETINDGLPDGPFKGVPFLLKDLGLLLNGTVTTAGSRLFQDNLADHDSTLVTRYKQAGLVIFGKTNTPEFGLMPVTEPGFYGPARNPWDTERTPGGSSGGASAAVAAGILPLANASDGGGSIRIPASCTGLVGLKPTRGKTPMGPDIGEGWGGQSISHIVSRTVRDSAAMLDATTGSEPGNPYEAPEFSGSYLSQVSLPTGKLNIAVCREKLGAGEFSAAVSRALEDTVSLLQSLGHNVVEQAPYFDPTAAERSFVILAANTALAIKNREELIGRKANDDELEPETRFIAEYANQLTSIDYARAILDNQIAGRKISQMYQQFDLVLMPTLSLEPVPIGFMKGNQDGVGQFMGNTLMFNQTGQPSISLPLCWSENNLPIGMMFTAEFGNDALLLRIAGQLEQAQPWFHRRAPTYSV